MSNKELDLSADYIDVRDIIARVEELREELGTAKADFEEASANNPSIEFQKPSEEDAEELKTLDAILDDLRGNGGDEQWEGDWYPVTLIRDSYFNDAMDELLEDIGDMPKNIPSYLKVVVDYDALQMDYTSTEIDGVTYWYR